MNIASSHKRKQRRHHYNLHNAEKRREMSAHLAGDLMERYNRRSFPLRKGDIVIVQRGAFKGHTGKVSALDYKAMRINVDGITKDKADGTQVSVKLDPSNVLITKLDLTDSRRKNALERKTGGKAKSKPAKEKASKSKGGKEKSKASKAKAAEKETEEEAEE